MQQKAAKNQPNKQKSKLPKRIVILHSDVKREYFPTEAQYITEKDADQDAALIAGYLQQLGIATRLLAGNSDLPAMLRKFKPQIVINLVDSVKGDESRAADIPGLLELLEIPYTGAGVLGLSLDTNKFLVMKLLQQGGVPVPHFQLFNTPRDPIEPILRFPLISKLNSVHGSVEITQDAVSEEEKHLRRRLRYLIHTYQQPVLVEEFISGREITAILMEGKKKRVYQAEKIFTQPRGKYTFLTFEDQWLSAPQAAFHYAAYEDPLLADYVKKAFNAVKMNGYGKFDIRLDHSGRYYFIDTNCNPAFGPKELDVALSVILDMYGISFYKILMQLIKNAARDSLKKNQPAATIIHSAAPG